VDLGGYKTGPAIHYEAESNNYTIEFNTASEIKVNYNLKDYNASAQEIVFFEASDYMHRGGEFKMFFIDNNHKKDTLMYWTCTAQEQTAKVTEINCTAVSDLATNGTIEELVLMEDSFGLVYEGVNDVNFYNLKNLTL
jgi:hypothetical protein